MISYAGDWLAAAPQYKCGGTLCISHGYVPKNLCESIIVAVIKIK